MEDKFKEAIDYSYNTKKSFFRLSSDYKDGVEELVRCGFSNKMSAIVGFFKSKDLIEDIQRQTKRGVVSQLRTEIHLKHLHEVKSLT